MMARRTKSLDCLVGATKVWLRSSMPSLSGPSLPATSFGFHNLVTADVAQKYDVYPSSAFGPTLGAADNNTCQCGKSDAFARCIVCDEFLCQICVKSHQILDCLEENRANLSLNSLENNQLTVGNRQRVFCKDHQTYPLKYYCRTCNVAICKQCTEIDHPSMQHNYELMSYEVASQLELLYKDMNEALTHIVKIKCLIEKADNDSDKVKECYTIAQKEINDAHEFALFTIGERKLELLKELDKAFFHKKMSLSIDVFNSQKNIDLIIQICNFIKGVSLFVPPEIACYLKELLCKKLQPLLNYNPEASIQAASRLKFVSNFQKLQVTFHNAFGNIYLEPIKHITGNKTEWPYSIGCDSSSSDNTGNLNPSIGKVIDQLYANGVQLTPPEKMTYFVQFGGYGRKSGQILENFAVTVNTKNDIIVADTRGNRVQVFDKSGRYKFLFSKHIHGNGRFFFPNQVTVNRNTGDIVITEQSPVPQIQIYTRNGQFIKKFGADVLHHPRSLTVDNKNRIIVVDCNYYPFVSRFYSTVVIFKQKGKLLQQFSCPDDLLSPNSVVVNNNQNIFISDKCSHCIKVFNYEGVYLRQIGGQGITNYPIGVGINSAGNILVASTDSNFNITIFSQNGQLITRLKSENRHVEGYGMALMNNGNVVLASKDQYMYIYRYR